jgi:hypothetical protein
VNFSAGLVIVAINKRMSQKQFFLRKSFPGMWRRVGLVRSVVSEEHIACIFRIEKHVQAKEMLAVNRLTILTDFAQGFFLT